jgi:glycosyltransferase involved in cell wall biosynthesis
VDPSDEEDLATVMARLAEDEGLARAHAGAGLDRAAGFSWAASARAMEAVLAARA